MHVASLQGLSMHCKICHCVILLFYEFVILLIFGFDRWFIVRVRDFVVRRLRHAFDVELFVVLRDDRTRVVLHQDLKRLNRVTLSLEKQPICHF